ncbi:MAG: MFS transporter [Eggerthellaceae bacterium]|nr:MFS transporter [Candidatus Aphodovivens avicola]
MNQSGVSRYARLVAASLIMICTGIIYMWSVFNAGVSAALPGMTPTDVSDFAFTSSVMITLFSFGALCGGKLQDKFGPKIVIIIGSIFFGIGVFLTSFTIDMGPIPTWLTFGVIGGFAVGCTYNSAIPCIQKWFPDKINVCMGIIVCCFGLASVVFTPLAQMLMDGMGVRTTFQILGVVFAVVCLLASILIKNPEPGWLPEGYVPAESKSNIAQEQVPFSKAIKTPQIWIIFLTYWFITAGFFSINPILRQLGMARGLEVDLANGIVMACGLGLAVGRFFVPFVVNAINSRHKTALGLAALVLVVSIALIFTPGIAFMVLVFCLAAFSGAPGAIYPAWTAENFGLANNGANYGFVMCGIGLSSLVSFRLVNQVIAPMFGGLSETGVAVNTELYFIVSAVFAVVSVALLLAFKTYKENKAE